MVVKDGNIDVPDYGNTVDGNGNAVHKFVYTVERRSGTPSRSR